MWGQSFVTPAAVTQKLFGQIEKKHWVSNEEKVGPGKYNPKKCASLSSHGFIENWIYMNFLIKLNGRLTHEFRQFFN